MKNPFKKIYGKKTVTFTFYRPQTEPLEFDPKAFTPEPSLRESIRMAYYMHWLNIFIKRGCIDKAGSYDVRLTWKLPFYGGAKLERDK